MPGSGSPWPSDSRARRAAAGRTTRPRTHAHLSTTCVRPPPSPSAAQLRKRGLDPTLVRWLASLVDHALGHSCLGKFAHQSHAAAVPDGQTCTRARLRHVRSFGPAHARPWPQGAPVTAFNSARLVGISVDCSAPQRLADFYRVLLGGRQLRAQESSVGIEVSGAVLVAQQVDGSCPQAGRGRRSCTWTSPRTISAWQRNRRSRSGQRCQSSRTRVGECCSTRHPSVLPDTVHPGIGGLTDAPTAVHVRARLRDTLRMPLSGG
jgi:hypothetical protein